MTLERLFRTGVKPSLRTRISRRMQEEEETYMLVMAELDADDDDPDAGAIEIDDDEFPFLGSKVWVRAPIAGRVPWMAAVRSRLAWQSRRNNSVYIWHCCVWAERRGWIFRGGDKGKFSLDFANEAWNH
ncbi:hypothetical protein B0H14DRAFT_2586333 [Mycena olivaceomarginata]|nr:hypothetical protein B0H14DRAFT_2586333 [Mycena olivaceomarginata]